MALSRVVSDRTPGRLKAVHTLDRWLGRSGKRQSGYPNNPPSRGVLFFPDQSLSNTSPFSEVSTGIEYF